MSRILITGGTLVTMATGSADSVSADILIEDDQIANIGAIPEARDAEVIDATGFAIHLPPTIPETRLPTAAEISWLDCLDPERTVRGSLE